MQHLHIACPNCYQGFNLDAVEQRPDGDDRYRLCNCVWCDAEVRTETDRTETDPYQARWLVSVPSERDKQDKKRGQGLLF